MATNAGNDASPNAVVFDGSREDVGAVVRWADGPILPARFNEIVAGEVGESVVGPEDENRLPGRPLTAFFFASNPFAFV